MSLEPDVKVKHSIKALVKSFRFAGKGILTALKICRNVKIHYIIGLTVLLAGIYFNISKVEFMILLLIIFTVICLEMVNTAIEQTINLLTEKKHVYAKIAKDVAAGAVLTAVIVAVILGVMIFFPHLQSLVSHHTTSVVSSP